MGKEADSTLGITCKKQKLSLKNHFLEILEKLRKNFNEHEGKGQRILIGVLRKIGQIYKKLKILSNI